MVTLIINGHKIEAMVDTGADSSFISTVLAKKLGMIANKNDRIVAQAFNESKTVTEGSININLTIIDCNSC